jgi:hypothetical protein
MTQENLKLPDPPDGLVASMDHEVHPEFREEFKGKDGVFLTFHDGHCLCHFESWNSLIRYSDSIRIQNNLASLQVMLFWTGTEYEEVIWREIDCELDTIDDKPEEGMILSIGVSISRRLKMSLEKRVKMSFKSGKTVRGILETYQEESDYGMLRTKDGEVHFTSKELENVEPITTE